MLILREKLRVTDILIIDRTKCRPVTYGTLVTDGLLLDGLCSYQDRSVPYPISRADGNGCYGTVRLLDTLVLWYRGYFLVKYERSGEREITVFSISL
jgi:hypothetical protein